MLKVLLGAMKVMELCKASSETVEKEVCVKPGSVRSAWISSAMTRTCCR